MIRKRQRRIQREAPDEYRRDAMQKMRKILFLSFYLINAARLTDDLIKNSLSLKPFFNLIDSPSHTLFKSGLNIKIKLKFLILPNKQV